MALSTRIGSRWPSSCRHARADAHQGWRRAIDTALESPNDINQSPDEAPVVPDGTYLVQPRSMVVLFALRTDGVKEGVGS